AASHRVAYRVAGHALRHWILEEGPAPGADDHDAVEDGLNHRRRRCRRGFVPVRIEKVPGSDDRVRGWPGVDGGRGRRGRRRAYDPRRGRRGYRSLQEERPEYA